MSGSSSNSGAFRAYSNSGATLQDEVGAGFHRASARASLGSVGATAVAIFHKGKGVPIGGDAMAGASFSDEMVITADRGFGSIAHFSLQLFVTGHLVQFVSDQPNAHFGAFAAVDWFYVAYAPAGVDQPPLSASGRMEFGIGFYGNTPTPEEIDPIGSEWGFYVGGRVGFSVGLHVEVAGQIGMMPEDEFTIPAGGASYFGNTVNWGGITGAVDSEGVALPGLSITSPSGVDYSQAIPEPSTTILAVLGFIVVSARRKRFGLDGR